MTDLSVCFTSPFSIKGSTRLYSLARELGQFGVEVTIILPKYDRYINLKKSLPYLKTFKMVNPYQIRNSNPIMSMLPYIPEAAYESIRRKVDIFQIFKTTPTSIIPGFIAATAKKRPFVIDCDDLEASLLRVENYPYYVYEAANLIEKTFPKLANGVVVGAWFIEKEMLEAGVPKEKMLLMRNGVDPDKFNPDLVNREEVRQHLGLDCPTVVFVGFLDQGSKKDLFMLLEAARIIKNSGKKAKFLVVGDGTAMPELREYVSTNDLKDCFVFVGFADPVPYIGAADVAVVPYIRSPLHGCSQKLFEYMSMAKPIVVTDAGELAYHVGNGKAGIVSKSEPKDLAEKLLFLLYDSKLQRSLGLAARARVLENYTWKSNAKKLLEFYSRVC